MNILIIGTLDTKSVEVEFIREHVIRAGHTPIVIDPGSSGLAASHADVTREQVVAAAGESLAQLQVTNNKAHIQNQMTKGLVHIVNDLYMQGKAHGVIAVGGGQGTAIATAAMRELPVGVPKVMVSTVACGKTPFGPYVGTKDVTMIHSVADINGLNSITRRIIAQATAAVCAMAQVELPPQELRELVAITQAGVTTPGVMAVKEQLEQAGLDVIAFHCNGIGGQAMEELMREGKISGVIDFSPHEITDLLFGGLMPAMPGRMSVAGQMGIPQVVAPGCADIRLHEWNDSFPVELRERPYVRHTPTHTHFRTTPEEMSAVAHYIAEQLNAGHGPRGVIVPMRGFSMQNRAGRPLFDEQSNLAFVDTLKRELSLDVKLEQVDAHINDKEFAGATVHFFFQLRKHYQEGIKASPQRPSI
ncbi:MAG: Tm-1-like ATP-binding domain-containing protein [Anaerolineae bacterium]|nr:Tm-1-like ATP-binding domain-containing protein [Anaerolineae bacterium]